MAINVCVTNCTIYGCFSRRRRLILMGRFGTPRTENQLREKLYATNSLLFLVNLTLRCANWSWFAVEREERRRFGTTWLSCAVGIANRSHHDNKPSDSSPSSRRSGSWWDLITATIIIIFREHLRCSLLHFHSHISLASRRLTRRGALWLRSIIRFERETKNEARIAFFSALGGRCLRTVKGISGRMDEKLSAVELRINREI